MYITNSKKELSCETEGVQQNHCTMMTVGFGIYISLPGVLQEKKNPRSQRMMSDHMAEMTRENITQLQLSGSYVTSRRPAIITTTYYYSFVRLITAVINYKITLTAHFSFNSDLFIKPYIPHIQDLLNQHSMLTVNWTKLVAG